MPYTAYVLDAKSRSKLLASFPPKFPDVIAHHVTEKFGVPNTVAAPNAAQAYVVGYACDDSLEAVVVTIDGTRERKDGKLYHITLSLDRSKGRKPVESNTLLGNGYQDVESIYLGMLNGAVLN